MNISRIAIFIAGVGTAVTGSAIAQYLPHQFADISQGAYFADAVGKWWGRGVIKGYDNGRFGPDDPVTRGQMAVILDRFELSTIDPLRQEIMQINRQLQPASPAQAVPFVPIYELPTMPSTEEEKSSLSGSSDLPPIDSNEFCTQTRTDLDNLFYKYRSCQVDADCELFVRSCGPYVTCGKAVTKNVLPTLERSVGLFEDSCTDAFPVACATCAPIQHRCEQGQCVVAVSEKQSLEERCTVYIREGEEETYCATCGNDVCELFERCVSSNCQQGACTQDCGGLYCPVDCN